MKIQLANPRLARLVADITGDGHLQIGKYTHLISFYSKNIDEIKKVEDRFYKLFKIRGKVYTDNRKFRRYKLFFSSKPISLYLKEIGIPAGNKTNTNFGIPEWILNGKDNVKRAYIQGMYDCEGYIYSNKTGGKDRWRIGLAMCKNKSVIEGESFI